MPLAARLNYYRRIFSAYLMSSRSHLSFWHEVPQVNPNAASADLGEYYMRFAEKARYAGPRGGSGIPMLDYRGEIGKQYNPIAIAQWGLGNYNLFCQGDEGRRDQVLAASNWLCAHLEQNSEGLWVWNHHFDWEYRTPLKAPWFSALAQGQGISLLVRAHKAFRDERFIDAAARAFVSFLHTVEEGGVTFVDSDGNVWLEEYIVSPPTHILNGCVWAAWGAYDYGLATEDQRARDLFWRVVHTLRVNLRRYDLGFWSCYEQSGTFLRMIASPFYHSLHIAQLQVMYRLTGDELFADYARRWQVYAQSRVNYARALGYKSVFKLCYY